MGDESNRTDLLAKWRDGDEEAAEAMYARYGERLWHVAKKQIGERLNRRIDADDIVQSVFRTFFRRTRDGEYPVDRSEDLWRLLVTITLNKVRRQAKFHQRKKRDVGAEVYAGDGELLPAALLDTPEAESAETLAVELEELFAQLSEPETDTLRLCLEGHSTTEIALKLGCTRWTVRRTLDRVGGTLRKRLREDLEE